MNIDNIDLFPNGVHFGILGEKVHEITLPKFLCAVVVQCCTILTGTIHKEGFYKRVYVGGIGELCECYAIQEGPLVSPLRICIFLQGRYILRCVALKMCLQVHM